MIKVKGSFQGKPTSVLFNDGMLFAPDSFQAALDDLMAEPEVVLSSAAPIVPDYSDEPSMSMLIESLFDSIDSTTSGLGAWWVDVAPSPIDLSKHAGPGNHPGTGTPQNVHGHGAGILRPHQGGASSKNKPITVYLVNEDGSDPAVSMDVLTSVRQLRNGKIVKIPARWQDTIITRIEETMATYDLDPEIMDRNLRTVLDSAMARYAEDPALVDADKFYEIWHEELLRIAKDTDSRFDEVVAAAAAISPGLDADINLRSARELAEMVRENPVLPDPQALATQFQGQAYLIRNPVYNENHKAVVDGLAEIGDPMPLEKRPSRLAVAHELDVAANQLRLAKDVRLLDLPPEAAARAAHDLRIRDQGVGFNVSKGYTNYAQAVQVLGDPDVTPDDVLLGIKTRSFYNNIIDPGDSFGRGDVTVDFHTVNYAAMGLGADKNTHIQGTPSLGGVNLGLRPAVADAIRRTATYAFEEYDMELSPLRVQEILWAEWRRGLGEGTWTNYNDTVFELKKL